MFERTYTPTSASVASANPGNAVIAHAHALPYPTTPETAAGRPGAVGFGGAAGDAVRNNADFASAIAPQALTEAKPIPPGGIDVHAILPPPATVKSWYLRSVGRDILHRMGVKRRMGSCGYRVTRGLDGVGLYARPDRAYGRVHGVCVCGQSMCCTVCAPRIAAFRGEEISEAYRRAVARGWVPQLETFTIPHHMDRRPDALLRQFRLLSDLWRSYGAGRKLLLREPGALGHHLAIEVTWSDKNGWHAHRHRLRYDSRDSFNTKLAQADWHAVLDSRGLLTRGAKKHSYHCCPVDDDIRARYVAKISTSVEAQSRAVGFEVTGAANKFGDDEDEYKGRNLNTLLLDYVRGDADAGVVWVNGVSAITATKVSSVRWSRNLRAKLGMTDEKTDEQIAADEALPTDVFLGSLNHHQWRHIIAHKAEFALLCAAQRGADAVNAMLSGLSLGSLNDDDPYAVWAQEKQRGIKE